MIDREIPPAHKWSDVDSYLHKRIRDLEAAMQKLREQPVNPEAGCTESVHVWLTGLPGVCLCGKVKVVR